MSSIITVERTNLVVKTFFVNDSDKSTSVMEKLMNDFIKKNKIRV